MYPDPFNKRVFSMKYDELYRQILQKMEEKDTEELFSILQKNDREEWTESAFTAIRQVLETRHVELPPQSPRIETPLKEPKKRISLKGMNKLLFGFYVLISIFCVSGLLTIITMFDNGVNSWTIGFGIIFGISFLTILGIIYTSWIKQQEVGKRINRAAYVIVFYTEQAPSPSEAQELAQGMSRRLECPVEIWSAIKTENMPVGPDDFVVAICVLACSQHGIEFDPKNDEIAFRSAMGLGVATITLH